MQHYRYDQNKIALVMNTFFRNAIDNSPESSVVTIKMERRVVEDKKGQSIVSVFIEDQREIQLTKDQTDDFENFLLQEKIRTGSGLRGISMAISSEIIKRHQGKLWAENIPEKGVKFCFTLPTNQEETKPLL